jgi:hypothetical protein
MEYASDVKADIWASRAVIVVGLLVFLCGIGFLGVDCLNWLRTGDWSATSIWTAWIWIGGPYPIIEWRGVQKIVLWLMDLPLSAVLILAGLLIMWGAGRANRQAWTRYKLLAEQRGLNRGP